MSVNLQVRHEGQQMAGPAQVGLDLQCLSRTGLAIFSPFLFSANISSLTLGCVAQTSSHRSAAPHRVRTRNLSLCAARASGHAGGAHLRPKAFWFPLLPMGIVILPAKYASASYVGSAPC